MYPNPCEALESSFSGKKRRGRSQGGFVLVSANKGVVLEYSQRCLEKYRVTQGQKYRRPGEQIQHQQWKARLPH